MNADLLGPEPDEYPRRDALRSLADRMERAADQLEANSRRMGEDAPDGRDAGELRATAAELRRLAGEH